MEELGSLRESKVHITIRNCKPLSFSFSREDIPEAEKETFFVEELSPEINLVAEDEEDWRTPFIEYFKHGVVPKEKGFADQLKKRVLRYVYTEDTLYRRSYDQLWLCCLSIKEAKQVIKEIHAGFCGAHQSGPKMRLKIKRMGYYWPSMVADCEEYAKKCHMCQVHGTFIHKAPNPLHPTVASWPFNVWELT